MSSFLYSVFPALNLQMTKFESPSGPSAGPSVIRRDLRIAGFALLWAVTFVAAAQLIERASLSRPVEIILALVPTILGAFLILGYTRYLRQIDELERLIQLHAMAWAFGCGILAIGGYSLLVRLGAPAVEPTIFAALMNFFFAIGLIIGRWRYK